MYSRRAKRLGRVLPLLVVGAGLSACGPTITAPDVVGMRLDDAHRKFEALDVDEFEDVDVIGDEDTIFLDSNWVVVAQDPPAGTSDVDTGTTIRLEVGNEDDSEVLEMIPPDSDFGREMGLDEEDDDEDVPDESEGPSDVPSASSSPSASPSPSETAEPSPTAESSPEKEKIAACVRREGNPGEIYVWNSYGSDQPPDAFRAGAGYIWDFGEKECITTTEARLRGVPPLNGYCTEVGKVADNRGYPVDQLPAPRIQNIIGQRGDC